MEASEGLYRSSEAKILALEQQLAVYDVAMRECDQSGVQAAKEIEEHFAQCINALAARKSVMLGEVAQRVNNQRERMFEERQRLEASIEASKQTLKSAAIISAVDRNAAEMLLRGLNTLAIPQCTNFLIVANLPVSLFYAIQVHGQVEGGMIPSHPDLSAKFAKAETITTLAGSTKGKTDGRRLEAKFNYPYGICMNPQDECLYVADYNSIRKVTLQGDVTTYVGITSGLNGPIGIVVNNKENSFYVVNYGNHTVSKISSSGAVINFVGSGKTGNEDGIGVAASFNKPWGAAMDQQTGNLYICDCYNHLIRKITPEGVVSTLAGSQLGYADGNGRSAMFNYPEGVCFDEPSQSLIVCDFGNHRIRRVQLNGDVSTLCKVPTPTSIVTSNGVLLVSSDCHKLYRVTPKGVQYEAVLIAGNGKQDRVDGRYDECSFFNPRGIALHEPSQSCFVVDTNNHAIRKVSFCTQ